MSVFEIIWKQWLKIGKAIGNFQAQVIFTIFYFLVLWPVGIAVRFFSDPLHLKENIHPSNFSLWDYQTESIEQARKQY